MIACIIEYAVTAGMEDRLGEAFAALIPEIQAIDGFISMDNFESQTRPGVLLEVSYWRDEGALQIWIDNAAHREKMLLGRKEIFSWYKISSVEIKRQIDWTRKAYKGRRVPRRLSGGRSALTLLFEPGQKLLREGLHRAPDELRIDTREMHTEYEMRCPHRARELLEALRHIFSSANQRSEQQRILCAPQLRRRWRFE